MYQPKNSMQSSQKNNLVQFFTKNLVLKKPLRSYKKIEENKENRWIKTIFLQREI